MRPMRFKHDQHAGFGPAILAETETVEIALDNMVCFHCRKNLVQSEKVLISSPVRKGIVIFSCLDHVSDAMNFLSKALDGAVGPVPGNLKLPTEGTN